MKGISKFMVISYPKMERDYHNKTPVINGSGTGYEWQKKMSKLERNLLNGDRRTS
jgi:hypothetical protein